MTERRFARAEDEGFTLVELIVSIAILGIVMTAVTGMLFATFLANGQTRTRLDGSADRQFSSTYFADDVFGAKGVSTGANTCGGSGTPIVELVGLTFSGSPAVEASTYVDYLMDGTNLVRVSCLAGPTSVTSVVVARGLKPGALPTVSQTPNSAQRLVVTMTVTQPDGSAYTLSGSRRTS